MKEMVNRNLEIGFTKFHLFQKQPFRVSSTNIMMGNGLVSLGFHFIPALRCKALSTLSV